jgi:hypothetical protein
MQANFDITIFLGFFNENGSSHNNGIAKRHHNLLTRIHECNVEKSFRKYCIISLAISGKSPDNIFVHAIYKRKEKVEFIIEMCVTN